MKKAVVDQIILWIVLFTIFVSFLFFVIDYSNAIKVKNNTDAIADYSARMFALNKDEDEIIAALNNKVKDDYIKTITSMDLVCTTDTTVSSYQVVVNVYATLTNSFLISTNNNIHSKRVVFNETSEFQKECTLNLDFN